MADAKLTRTELLISLIDPRYARQVRAEQSDDHVERLMEAYRNKEPVPPVECYTWHGSRTYLLADGSHRVHARTRLGKQDVMAEVCTVLTEDDARRACLERAVRANEHTALTRSPADKRAAVAAVLTSPDHAKVRDRAVAELVKVHHALVRQVRERLSHDGAIPADSPAHASKQPYKEGATLRAGMVSDGKGGLVPKPAPAAPPPPPAEPVPVPSPATQPVGSGRATTTDAPADPVPPPLSLADDDRRDTVGVACPLLSPAGGHWADGECQVCGGAGSISLAAYNALDPELRAAAEQQAAPTGTPAPELPPAHPFDKLMSRVTGLATLFTQTLNEDSEFGRRLKLYLSHLSMVHHQDRSTPDRHQGPAFTHLRGLRRVVDLAGRPGREKTADQVRAEYAGGDE